MRQILIFTRIDSIKMETSNLTKKNKDILFRTLAINYTDSGITRSLKAVESFMFKVQDKLESSSVDVSSKYKRKNIVSSQTS